MKTNKLKEFFSKDVNFVGQAKYYLATLGAILISAIILICVLGLNLGFDYRGGTVVEVVYGVEFDASGNSYEGGAPYNEKLTQEKIEKVLSNFGGFEEHSVQTSESEFGNKVVYKLVSSKQLSSEDYETLKTNLFTEFDKYDSSALLQSNYISVYGVSQPANSNDIAIYASIALSVSIVVLCLAAIWRFGAWAALSLFITCILNVLACFAVVLICRTTVNTAFVGSVLTVFGFTVVSNLILLDKIRDNKNKGLSQAEIANLSVKQSFVPNVLVFAVSLICCVLLTGFGVLPIRDFGVPVLIGCIFAFLSAIYLTPFLWTYIRFGKKTKKAKNK